MRRGEGAVVKPTDNPFWHAASTSRSATWVLPVHDGHRPMALRRATHLPRLGLRFASHMTACSPMKWLARSGLVAVLMRVCVGGITLVGTI